LPWSAGLTADGEGAVPWRRVEGPNVEEARFEGPEC